MEQLGTIELEVRYDRRRIIQTARLVRLIDVRKKNDAKKTLREELAASYLMLENHFADSFEQVIEAIVIGRFTVHGRTLRSYVFYLHELRHAHLDNAA
jgi:hypothetical protein